MVYQNAQTNTSTGRQFLFSRSDLLLRHLRLDDTKGGSPSPNFGWWGIVEKKITSAVTNNCRDAEM